MGRFIEILNNDYEEECFIREQSKLEYLSTNIFGFNAYDSGVEDMYARNMLEVLKCIVDRLTFEYQDKSKEKYINYLMMVNMPFLADKLEWGTSVRGAWLDDYKAYRISGITIEKQELSIFISDVIEWSEIED